LPDAPPVAPVVPLALPEARRSWHGVRRAMAGLDYQETINFSFVEERWERELAGNADPIRVLNPIASPLAVMRSGLVGSLVQVLRYNLARKAARVRVFEVGRVFARDATVLAGPASVDGVRQPVRLGGLAWGPAQPLQWGRKERAVDFHDVKGDIEALLAPRVARFVADTHPALHPGRCARIELDGCSVGVIGELHPRWRQAYELPSAPVLFELDADAALGVPLPAFAGVPRQQGVTRDIAIVVRNDATHDAIQAAVLEAATDGLLRQATLFDIYKPAQPGGDIGANERSVALRLELLDEQTTPTDERIDAVVAAVIDALARRLGARLRG
jgi:phenylalanyl-tRNA synthetase beta chain